MRVAAILVVLFVALFGASTPAIAAPSADLWPRWQAHGADSSQTIDNSAYNAFLKRYVVTHGQGPNGVRYDAVTPADVDALAGYIKHMESMVIDDYARPEQRAYWINLYNAETLKLVIDHWPVDSIRDIDSGLFDAGPWDEKRLTVEDQSLSLNDIEHRILRPIWPDGMTHYGVNCASISCPSLRATAYTGANVDETLATNARAYIDSPEGVRFESQGNELELVVSKIYDWYGADFGGVSGVLKHLKRYADAARAKRLADRQDIDGYRYDWRVNSEANVSRLGS